MRIANIVHTAHEAGSSLRDTHGQLRAPGRSHQLDGALAAGTLNAYGPRNSCRHARYERILKSTSRRRSTWYGNGNDLRSIGDAGYKISGWPMTCRVEARR